MLYVGLYALYSSMQAAFGSVKHTYERRQNK